MAKLKCSVAACERDAHCRGWCALHYNRWRTHGDPEKTAERAPAQRREPVTDDVPSKVCPTCHRRLSLDSFSKSRDKKDGLASRCKDCWRDAYNKRYRENPEFRATRSKYTEAYYNANAEKQRRDRRKNLNRYGITFDHYESMATAQAGVCAICGRIPYEDNPLSRKRRLAVDHDHSTGVVRGLLCDPCNTGLGMFRDNPDLLRAAADYLDRACQNPETPSRGLRV